MLLERFFCVVDDVSIFFPCSLPSN
jgi:hypothetical protein